MKTLIIGGGKIGYFLLKTLKDRAYSVVLIERDESTCKKIAEELDADIICGDGTDPDVLKDAGIEEAEVIAAVTGTDEENLVICKIAKTCFNINKTIARINSPKNTNMFQALGVDTTVCSTGVIANLIEQEFDKEEYRVVQTLDRGSMILAETRIADTNHWRNCLIKDLELPSECVIASILRSDKVIFPRGNTQILVDDRILIITNQNALAELKKHSKTRGVQNVWQKK